MLDRIILASSNESDKVWDPFCVCATAKLEAHNRLRQWLGIDVSSNANDLVRQRITEGSRSGLLYILIQCTDVPQRDNLGALPAYNCADNRNRLYVEQSGD